MMQTQIHKNFVSATNKPEVTGKNTIRIKYFVHTKSVEHFLKKKVVTKRDILIGTTPLRVPKHRLSILKQDFLDLS